VRLDPDQEPSVDAFVINDQHRPERYHAPPGVAANQSWKGTSSMDQQQLSWVKAHPDTVVQSHMPAEQWWQTLKQPPPDAVADSHYAFVFGSDAAAVLYGGLEDIHTVLMRAMAEVLQLWTDETRQPGEPVDSPDTPALDLTDLPAWKRWVQTPQAQQDASDVPVSEFHRTDPAFWNQVAHLLAAARTGAVEGDDVPPLLPVGADHLTVLPLATGEAIVQITMCNGVRVTTAPLSRRRLTPSVGGVDAAAQVLAVTAAEIAAATQAYPTTHDH